MLGAWRIAYPLLLFIPTVSSYGGIPRVVRLANKFSYRSNFRCHGTVKNDVIRDDSASADMIFKTRNWVHQWVSGLGLCPWSASMLVGERMKIAVINDRFISNPLLVDKVIAESKKLYKEHKLKRSPVETVLLVLSHNDLSDYHTYLDFIEDVESELDRLGVDPYVQVASFHPDYVFQDTDKDSVENYTNRSPFPTVHLLLVSKVAEAIESYSDKGGGSIESEESGEEEEGFSTDAIWKRNIALLQQMGIGKVSKIHESMRNARAPLPPTEP